MKNFVFRLQINKANGIKHSFTFIPQTLFSCTFKLKRSQKHFKK